MTSARVVGVTVTCDVGLVEYVALDGTAQRRHFVNVSSFGVSGRVVRELARGDLRAQVDPGSAAELEREAAERMAYLVSCYSSPGDPRRGPYVLAVDHLASGLLLGHVGFSPFDDDVEVSYAIAESHRRRGYGSEALNRACQWAATSFGLPRLLAITEYENAPSRLTLDRAGFVHGQDSVMRFQGVEQQVSHYTWRPGVAGAR